MRRVEDVSQDDRDTVADFLVYRNQSLYRPLERNDVTLFTLGPRRLYRITQALYDELEHRHHTNPVEAMPVFHSPEFHMRKAAAPTAQDTVRE